MSAGEELTRPIGGVPTEETPLEQRHNHRPHTISQALTNDSRAILEERRGGEREVCVPKSHACEYVTIQNMGAEEIRAQLSLSHMLEYGRSDMCGCQSLSLSIYLSSPVCPSSSTAHRRVGSVRLADTSVLMGLWLWLLIPVHCELIRLKLQTRLSER